MEKIVALGLNKPFEAYVCIETGALLMYQKMSGSGREPLRVQLMLTVSPGETERGAWDMNGPEGIAEEELLN